MGVSLGERTCMLVSVNSMCNEFVVQVSVQMLDGVFGSCSKTYENMYGSRSGVSLCDCVCLSLGASLVVCVCLQ